jgi:hypothetical protein
MNVLARLYREHPSKDLWMRCVNCRHPHLEVDGAVYPPTSPFAVPKGVEGEELAAWNEVRRCLSVGAHSAATMMCRKLLLHVAVAQGMDEKNSKGWAPTFKEINQFLETEGIITKRMAAWVELIRDAGNEAAHDIAPISREDAYNVAKYTEQLLRMTYELGQAAPIADADPPAAT